jgi:hypothetical protein
MKNLRIKKGLGVIILLLFLSTTCLPIVNASEGKPDLMIEDLLILPGHQPGEEEFRCRVKNIGDASTPSGKFIDITVIVRWKILDILPLIPVRKFIASAANSLAPNETANIPFAYSDSMPIFGFYEFYCTVNPKATIDESNYQNNFKTDTVLFILRLTLNSWF